VTRSSRLLIALALNAALVIGLVIFGLAAHSLGLLADAGHNLTDVAAIVISLVAVRLVRRAPNEAKSFGYHRSSILAALVNAAMILALTAFIAYEAINRLANPQPVRGGLVVIVALVAFALNASAALVLRERGKDMNMRSALLHMAGDAVASLGVAVAGVIILATGRFLWLDPIVSLGIGVLISKEAWSLLRQAVEVLLEATPAGLDLRELQVTAERVEGVAEVHDLHVWSLSSEVRALSAHVVVTGHPTLEQAQAVGVAVKGVLEVPFSIAHATLELECERCVDDEGIPCTVDSALATVGRQPEGHDD
jgi:cobalt-zinc-cadmium efflux system protein